MMFQITQNNENMRIGNHIHCKIGWHELKDYELILLKKGVLKRLVGLCAAKAGNLNRFSKESGLTYPSLYSVLAGGIEMVSVSKLKKLVEYIGLPYDNLNTQIIGIGKNKKYLIKNPRLPFVLDSGAGASLLGAVVSDGCIYIDKKARFVRRTKYSSENLEAIDMFVENLRRVFGDVYIQRENVRNCITIRVGSSIVGDALSAAGAIVGKKYKVDEGVPWVVKEGSLHKKILYLRNVFEDEGSMGRHHKPYIILSRYKHMDLEFEERHVNFLNRFIVLHMKLRRFSTGHVVSELPYGVAMKIIENAGAREKLKKEVASIIREKATPKLLTDESSMLGELGINNHVYVSMLTKTSNGFFSIKSTLLIRRKKSVLKFYKKIGFPLPKKRMKLERILNEAGWLKVAN